MAKALEGELAAARAETQRTRVDHQAGSAVYGVGGLEACDSGFGVKGSVSGVYILDSEFGVYGLGFGVCGLWFMVCGPIPVVSALKHADPPAAGIATATVVPPDGARPNVLGSWFEKRFSGTATVSPGRDAE